MSAAFWHPFADMSVVAGHELVIASGRGCVVTSELGDDYLDSTAALWFCNIGHGRGEIADAVARQLREIAAYSSFGDTTTRPTIDLADRLAAIAPMADAKVFFTSGGSDCVDTAVKLARRYWALLGQPRRTTVVTRSRSYHGMHLAGTALAGIDVNREGHGTLDTQVAQVAWDDAVALADLLEEHGQEIAAFFCEPVIGAGGVLPAPPGYLESVRALCREHGVLFVADEVITGYGRTGRMFASEGLEPDLVLTAKGLTSGYLPMGAVLVAGAVADPFWRSPGGMWRHGYTYSGHAAAAAAAMANLDVLEAEDLVARVAQSQLTLAAALSGLRAHEWVVDVRSGPGLLGAVQVDPAVISADPGVMAALVAALRERGVLGRALVDGSLQLSPPFVITREQLGAIASAIDDALAALGSSRGPSSGFAAHLLPEITRDEQGGFGHSDARLLADVPPHHGS